MQRPSQAALQSKLRRPLPLLCPLYHLYSLLCYFRQVLLGLLLASTHAHHYSMKTFNGPAQMHLAGIIVSFLQRLQRSSTAQSCSTLWLPSALLAPNIFLNLSKLPAW